MAEDASSSPQGQHILRSWSSKDRGDYLYITECAPNIISIFDELNYDRSDADMVSPAMRMHIVKKLGNIGFKQKTGNILENKQYDIRCIIPKSHALGASPFHITDYTKKREQDFFVLTPTQSACQFIQHFPVETAIEHIHRLIKTQPINLKRLTDYLEMDSESTYASFLEAIGHLKYLQRTEMESGSFKKLKPLSLTRH